MSSPQKRSLRMADIGAITVGRKADRILCCVPHCRRTMSKAKADEKRWHEWMCAVHWREIPVRLRSVHLRVLRQATQGKPVTKGRADRIWSRVKRYAIERAGGLC